MSNTTTNPKNRSNSKFLHQRRISFLSKRTAKSGFQFLKLHKGSLNVSRMPSGSFRAVFNSRATGRKAFAYGANFTLAYQNMIRLFNLKYAI